MPKSTLVAIIVAASTAVVVGQNAEPDEPRRSCGAGTGNGDVMLDTSLPLKRCPATL